MGYGTRIRLPYGSIYFNKETLNSLQDLKAIKENTVEYIQAAKEDLMMLAAGTPKDIFPNEEDVLLRVKSEFSEKWDWIEECYYKMIRADIVLDELARWEWKQDDDYGETLDPLLPEDWMKISSGDFVGNDNRIEAASLTELDEELGKIFGRYSFKNTRIKKRYVLYYDSRLYRTQDGLFFFSSEEQAVSSFLSDMGLEDSYFCDNMFDSLTERKYLDAHKDFLTDEIAKYIIPDDGHCVSEFLSLIEELMTTDDKQGGYYDTIHKLHKYIHQAVREYVMHKVIVKEMEI